MGGPGSGRRAAPTNLKLLRGTQKSRLQLDRPLPPVGTPEPPAYMSPEVRKIWDYYVPIMEMMGTASPAVRDLLAALCEQIVTQQDTCRLMADPNVRVIRKGATEGTIVKNPLVQIQRDSALTIRILSDALGLTPNSHTARRNEDDGTGPERLLT